MDILTPELQCYSILHLAAPGTDTREIDFNLARRSAIVINSIDSTMKYGDFTTVTISVCTQELDLDPDNVACWQTAQGAGAEAVEVDSSRLLRHSAVSTGAAPAGTLGGYITELSYFEHFSWLAVPIRERPMSITNLRHHVNMLNVTLDWVGELCIRYQILELSLAELGYLNASRR